MVKYTKLSVKALVALGAIVWGIYLFIATLFASAGIETFWFSNKAFEVISSIYPGLTATTAGAFIGLIWGVICGAICGGIFGFGYNWLTDKLEK